MKRLGILLLMNLTCVIATAQNCGDILLDEDFSSSAGWTTQGNGDVNISNGYVNFNNAASGDYNRVYKSMSQAASNNYWKAQCDLTILGPNASGNGTGAIVMALTAGTLDFMTYNASQSYQETNQDGISVVLTSASQNDNNINNWFFLIESKKGNVRQYDMNAIIYASSSVSDYYISLERTSASTSRLSVYSDAARTVHMPGSPVTFNIDPLITGLNTVQHGIGTAGSPSRMLNGRLDNSFVCQTSTSTCANIILDDDFSNSNAWTQHGNGDVYVSNGSCVLNNVAGGVYNRVYQPLNQTLSNSYWKAECDFNITGPNQSGHGTGAIVMALTAGTLDFMTYDQSQSYQETNQDGIAIILTSSSQTDNNINNWFFLIESKNGNVRSFDINTAIYLNSSVSSYYLSLERTTAGGSQLSVYTDAARTTHISGSPVQFTIDPLISGLNVVQHASSTASNPVRMINATVDNTFICQDEGVGMDEVTFEGTTEIAVYPNPTSDLLYLKVPANPGSKLTYRIYNINGQVMLTGILNDNREINIAVLAAGTYSVVVSGETLSGSARFIKR